VDGGIVSGFWILEGNAGDEAQLQPSLEGHLRLFGGAPELVAADRNVHSKENERLAKGFGVKKVCLPKAGNKSAEREEYEGQRWYKRARRFRAGIEGRISVMARREYLGRRRDRDEEGFGRWVGWGVLTQPAHHSPNAGGPVMLEGKHGSRRTDIHGHNPISHRKLSSRAYLDRTRKDMLLSLSKI